MQKSLCCKISWILTSLGALNWGAFGLFGVNPLHSLLGDCCPLIERGAYVVVGVAGLLSLYAYFTMNCSGEGHKIGKR